MSDILNILVLTAIVSVVVLGFVATAIFISCLCSNIDKHKRKITSLENYVKYLKDDIDCQDRRLDQIEQHQKVISNVPTGIVGNQAPIQLQQPSLLKTVNSITTYEVTAHTKLMQDQGKLEVYAPQYSRGLPGYFQQLSKESQDQMIHELRYGK